MLRNASNSRVLTAMDEISRSSFDFYLTGSRFFGNDTASSDIDLMVVNQAGLVNFLTNLGFITNSGRYDDSSVNAVYSLHEGMLSEDRVKLEAVKTIDVQVIRSDEWLARKIRAQEALKYSGLGKRLNLFNEEDRRGIWESVISMAFKDDIKLLEKSNTQEEIILGLSKEIEELELRLSRLNNT